MQTSRAPIHLASASPRRKRILEALGLSFTATGVEMDESRLEGETADVMVLRLAAAKAQLARERPGQIVVAADTAVVLDTEVFGKPLDREQGLDMLARLSNRTHRVLTGVAVRRGDEVGTALSTTDVRFREIRPDEALAYWQSGEPGDKAGAYAIQGLGGVFVREIVGSYSGVVGLPVYETARLLRDVGVDVVPHARRKP